MSLKDVLSLITSVIHPKQQIDVDLNSSLNIEQPITFLSSLLQNNKTINIPKINEEVKKDETIPKEVEIESYIIQPNIQLEENDNKYIDGVLVLSGGATKGIIQLGVLHCLQNKNIINTQNFNSYIGTSIGSIISYLLVIGCSPIEILTHICSKEININTQLNLLKLCSDFCISSLEDLIAILEQITEEKLGFIPTFTELFDIYHKDLTCVVHNLTSGYNQEETVYINRTTYPHLSCLEAIKMSCTIPILFQKCKVDNNYFIDGAFSDNFAVKYASITHPDKNILGICIDRTLDIDIDKINLFDYFKLLINIPLRRNNKQSKNFTCNNLTSIIITIVEPNELVFDFKNKKFQLFSAGYQTTLKLIKEKRKLNKQKIE